MRVVVTGSRLLRFDDGSPVRSASAIARFGDGWLIAQDDATHAACWRSRSIRPLRLFPAVDGHEVFSEDDGTKSLKPDLEAACAVRQAGLSGVLLLGSGSAPARARGALVLDEGDEPRVLVADLAPLYRSAAAELGLPAARLNFEGACCVEGRLRWFTRGNRRSGAPDASVDVDLDTLLAAFTGEAAVSEVAVGQPRRYDLGEVDGVGLAITDAVSLGDGRVLVSAAAEDTPNAVDDGPVAGAALAVLQGDQVVAVAPIEAQGGRPPKVEGLALRAEDALGVALTAVVDADDPGTPSAALGLLVRWQ